MNISSEVNEQSRTNFAALRWDPAWIDPAIRRLAETAARQSGLTIEAWIERAIRRACGMPAAPHLAREVAEQPAAPAKGFSALLNGARADARAEPPPVAPVQGKTAPEEPRLFAEPKREPMALRERIGDTPVKKYRQSRPVAAAERGGSRAVSMIGAAGLAAVLAIIAVALVREGGTQTKRESLNSGESGRQTVSTLPPVSALDHQPLRVSRNATDRSVTFAAVPPPAIETDSDESAPGHAAPASMTMTVDADQPGTADETTQSAAAIPETPSSTPAVPATPVQMAALPAQQAAPSESQKPAAAPEPVAAVAPPAKQAIAAPPPPKPSTPPAAPRTQVAMAATTPAPPPAPAPAPSEDTAQTQSEIKVAAALVPQVKAGDHVAEYRLGILYALGRGVPHDYDKAAALLHRSALSGLPEAEYDYGVLCDKGLGVPRDSAEAARWYAKAAQQGHPPAALNLGYAYAEGLGVTRNLPEAAHWFRRAAEAGLVNAQFNLAYMFEQGAGVTKSATDAYAWYSIAADSGDQGAQEALQRIEAKMSVRELSTAKARIRSVKRTIRVQH